MLAFVGNNVDNKWPAPTQKPKIPQMLPLKWWWWGGWEKEKLTEEIGTSYLLFKASIAATV